MWRKSAEPSSTTVPAAAVILDTLILLILVPIAALIFIARAYLSLARFIVAPTEDPHQTGDGTDEEKPS